MKTSKRAIRIDFPKHIRAEYIDMSNSILSYVQSISPYGQKLNTVNIVERGGVTIAGKIYYGDNNQYIPEALEKLTWSELESNVPKLKHFFEKYDLEHSFTLAEGVDVPPHRHHYSVDSRWSISIFMGESSGTIKFFESKEAVGAKEVTEYVQRDYSKWNVSETLKSYAGDFYSINTWNWHGWRAEDLHLNSFVCLYYMKGASTYDKALARIKQIADDY